MSHVEQSVICLHCQKVHNAGFIWKFSDTVRVCFTCFREMGEDVRKGYERRAARGLRGKGYALKMIGILTLLIVVLGAGACYFYKPLNGEIAQLRAHFP
jgi:hypothetical protein